MRIQNSKNTSHSKGQWGEKIAQKYLHKKGLRTVTKNYRSITGEIDLIMRDKDDIVFVEVRYRSNNKFYSALESIDQWKCKRITKTSEFYMQQFPDAACNNYRFDVLAIDGDQNNFSIEWIKNAF